MKVSGQLRAVPDLPSVAHYMSARGGSIKALRYKPEGRGFDSRKCHNPSGFTVTLVLTQTLHRNKYQEYFLRG